MKPAVVVPSPKAQAVRKLLEEHGLWDKTRKLQKQQDSGNDNSNSNINSNNNDNVLIPVTTSDPTLLSCLLLLDDEENDDDDDDHHHHNDKNRNQNHDNSKANLYSIVQADLPPSKSQLLLTPAQQLLDCVRKLVLARWSDLECAERERLLGEVSRHWEMHGDLVLLPDSAFVSAQWQSLGQDLWHTVAQCTRAKRVARRSLVCPDGFRTPQVQLLLGESAVVQHVDNGIKYEYDLTRCMFSAGNVTEKLRIAKFCCSGETVVDLYAGIGYFTLPYLVHAGASHVHACEWNPDALAALTRNLQLNHVDARCTLHPGDNRKLILRGVAHRVNLGLIPSSEEGWPMACRVLRPTGGIMHVHANVNSLTALGERHPSLPQSQSQSHPSQPHSHPQSHPSHPQSHPAHSAMEESHPSQPQNDLQSHPKSHPSDSESHPSHLESHPSHPESHSSHSESHPSHHESHRAHSALDERHPSQPQDHPQSHLESHPPHPESHPSDLVLAGREHPSSLGENHSVHPDLGGEQHHPSPGECRPSHQECREKGRSSVELSEPHPTHPVEKEHFSPDDDDATTERQAKPCANKTEAWGRWGDYVCDRLKGLLEEVHGGVWGVKVVHTEHVKSYAPHVHHVVLDIECSPLTTVVVAEVEDAVIES